jgi:hypothetical protein
MEIEYGRKEKCKTEIRKLGATNTKAHTEQY